MRDSELKRTPATAVRAAAQQTAARSRVVLADEEPIFLEGLRGLCTREGLNVIAVTTEAPEVVPLVTRERPDILVLGAVVGPVSQFETVRQIQKSSPTTKVLLLTGLLDERRLANAWQAGARGVAPRSLAPNELVRAVQDLSTGRTYVWRDRRTGSRRVGSAGAALATALSSREYDVLGLIADGKSIKQIAAVLGIAPKTVEHHRAHICKKLAVQTTAHLVRSAVRLGLVAL